jgi:hypothetical protein
MYIEIVVGLLLYKDLCRFKSRFRFRKLTSCMELPLACVRKCLRNYSQNAILVGKTRHGVAKSTGMT